MKKVLILILFAISITGFSQPFKGFFKPIPNDLLKTNILPKYKLAGFTALPYAWIFRPQLTISAMQIMVSKEAGKQVDVTSLNKAGVGLSYSHFVDNNGVPYNDYSFNLIALFDVVPAGETAINLSPVLSVSALSFVSAGVGYDIGAKKVFGLLGISYNFSK